MPIRHLHLFLTLLLFLIVNQGYSQFEDDEFYYGFFAGGSRSNLQEVQTTLIRPIFPTSSYSTSLSDRWGFTAGTFIHYRFKDSRFAIEPQLFYQDGGGVFSYEDIEEFNYDITFKYAYIKLSPIVKYYPVKGFYIELGPELGFVVDRSNLNYTSNQPDLGPDLQIKQSLSEVLKANHMVSMMIGAGYDLPMGLGIDFKYQIGVSDALETLANGFYFIENKNPSNALSITLSYAIPFVSSPY